jgi:ribosomal protection tetracycline resistance protein
MAPTRPIRNIAVLAHVDAGKTTLTENMLFLSGSTRSIGKVDKGTSLSDILDVEKERGISVRAASVSFDWQHVQVNLIDTPGHVDFSAEVERSLRVLDAAVLVVSAVEGVQAHTETLWRALQARDIPVLLFINKIDRMGADAEAVYQRLRAELTPRALRLNRAAEQGDGKAAVAELLPEQYEELVERVAGTDDALLERYLAEEPLSREEVDTALAGAVRDRLLYPVLCGSAKNEVGVRELLDQIVACLPDADTATAGPVSGVVFRIDNDTRLGRIAGVRLYSGALRNRDTVANHTAGRQEKITQIKKSFLNRLEDSGELLAGDIGFLCGMPQARIDDILGDPGPVPDSYRLSEPLLSVQVRPVDEADHTALAEALQQLSSEDPHLDFRWFSAERELHVRIMGTVQTEILTEILRSRFGLAATFSAPTVIYRETPARSGHGADSYTMPKPCWAIVRYLLEPGERGSGVTYRSQVPVDHIKQKYQKEISACLTDALKQGIKGWEVTDLSLTLVEGSDHVLHSRPGNFKLATHIALMKGLSETGTVLLEPYLAFRIAAPEEFVGKVNADIIHMRGTADPAEMTNGQFILRGRVPLATSLEYAIRLSSRTGGRGTLSARFDGYEACPHGVGETRPYRGICPLDRSKYILKMRGAITESVRPQ